MARTFTDAGDKHLKCPSAVVTAKPLTLACWIYPTTTTQDHYMAMSLGNSANYYDQYYIGYSPEWPSAGDRTLRFVQRDSSGSVVESKTGLSVNGWNHIAGTIDSSGNMKAYVNSNASTGQTGSRDPASLNQTGVGCLARGTSYDYFCFEGSIAEGAIWDADLTADEIAVLAAGYSPLFVRPQNLKAYWPLIRQCPSVDNPDLVGGFDLTDYNSPGDTAHCRVIRPAPRLVPAPAQATGEIAVLMMHYKKMRVA